MEELLYEPVAAKAYILTRFTDQGDFAFLGDALPAMIEEVMDLDNAYIEHSGANEDGVYDDDEAFDFMFEEMSKAHPDYKMYMMRFVEDYMEYSEAYLESIGAIEWDE